MRKILFMALSLCLVCLSAGDEKPVKYRWPLDINGGFSSTFQEYRSGHFHAGLDLRTFQQTGYPVYAIADGLVFKIRVSKRNSGNSVYLKHLDGNASVYFHLDRFSEKLTRLARVVQTKRGRKYFGSYVLSSPQPVKKGEVIAYSGETGYGFPHLHIEIRNKDNVALNPLHWLEVPGKDANLPRIKRLLVRNRGDGLINGSIGESSFAFIRKKAGVFGIKDPIVVSGGCDLVLQTHDISDTGRFSAPYRVSAWIDGQPFFDLAFDRFTYSDNNQLGFVYDMFYSNPSAYYFNLFYQTGFNLEKHKSDFALSLDKLDYGEHELKIAVTDHFANTATGFATLCKVRKPEIELTGIQARGDDLLIDVERLTGEEKGKITLTVLDEKGAKLYWGDLDRQGILEKKQLVLSRLSRQAALIEFSFFRQGVCYYSRRYGLETKSLLRIDDIDLETFVNRQDVYVKIKNPALTPDNLALKVVQAGESRSVSAECSADGMFFHFSPQGPDQRVLLHFSIMLGGERVAEIEKRLSLINLQPGVRQEFKDGEFSAQFDPRSVYEPRVLWVEERQHKADYPLLSRQFSLAPYYLPFLDRVYYRFKMAVSKPGQVGIFRYQPLGNYWLYVPSEYDRDNQVFKARLRSSGTFALMRDVFPPRIRFYFPQPNSLAQVKELIVRLTDQGKGVNDETLAVWLNGRKVTGEYDPDWRRVKIVALGNLQRGRNTLKIEVRDYAWNLSQKTFHFTLK